MIITSADSRIRVIDGDELVHKFKGNMNRLSSNIEDYCKHLPSFSIKQNILYSDRSC